ncbi:MAG: alpha/beta fold hydrolase [Bacillota bacterium]
MLSFEQDMVEFERLFPKQMKLINGVEFTYRLAGSGEKALVLLVGGLGMSDLLYNHARRFAEDFKVLMFDYPYGYNANNELADGIAALIRELNLSKAALVGQSYGGFIAQVIAFFLRYLLQSVLQKHRRCSCSGHL